MTRAKVIVLVILTSFGTASLCASCFGAKIQNSAGQYYWETSTFDSGTFKRLDPLELIWDPGQLASTMTESTVRAEVEKNWNATRQNTPPSSNKMTFTQLCLGQRFTKLGGDAGQQYAFFRRDQSLGGSYTTRLTDYQGSTSSHCKSQYHMRFWSDTDIAANNAGYGSTGQVAISGVHHERAAGTQCLLVSGTGECLYDTARKHAFNRMWDAYRNYAVERGMRLLCGRSHYRQRIGANHLYQGRMFDGWYGLIKDTFDTSGCPDGLR